MAYQGVQVTFQGIYQTGINGKNTGSTLIFTPTADFTPQNIIFELQSVSGFVVVGSASIGTNSTSYNNILPITALTGLSTANNILTLPLIAVISKVTAGTPIYINITTGYTTTTAVLKVTITGIYN